MRTLLSGTPYGATPDETGEYMLGDVYVTVVLMESNDQLSSVNDNSETWTAQQIADVKAKVEDGLAWWEDTLASITNRHSLNFIIDYTYADQPVLTSYEPIANPSTAYRFWIYDFLRQVGQTDRGSPSADIRAFNHSQRVAHSTNWAFTIFVVNDNNDPDGKFAEGGFERAFAFSGGRFFVTPAGRPASTIAHETAHMFWALDEYPGGGNYTDRRGYYNVQNLNAWNNPDFGGSSGQSQQPSILLSWADPLYDAAYSNHTSSTTSLEMIGWRDSDGDGVFDVLDVPQILQGAGWPDPANDVYRFRGTATVQTFPNLNSYIKSDFLVQPPLNDMTIAEVSRVQYRVDGGLWQTAAEIHEYTPAIDVAIPLPPAARTIEIRTIDDTTGMTSNVFQGTLDQPSVTLPSTSIAGFVWNDANGDGAWQPTEVGQTGVTLQLVDQIGQPLSFQNHLEPDDFEQDTTPLNEVLPNITVSAAGISVSSDSVFSVSDQRASTGSRVFGHCLVGTTTCTSTSTQWTSLTRQLRVDFAAPVKAVSLDAVGTDGQDYGRLEAYDGLGRLIKRYTTQALASGESERMTVRLETPSIAYVIAKAHRDTTIAFDDLLVGPSSRVVTDSLGRYSFDDLDPGSYRVQIVGGPNQIVTSPNGPMVDVELLAGSGASGGNFGILSATSQWQNPQNPLDVSGDGFVSPIDALQLINDLNTNNARPLTAADAVPPYLDVNGDGMIAPIDVLIVIDALNAATASEGETSVVASAAAQSSRSSDQSDGEGELPSGINRGTGVERRVAPALASLPSAGRPSLLDAATFPLPQVAISDRSRPVTDGEVTKDHVPTDRPGVEWQSYATASIAHRTAQLEMGNAPSKDARTPTELPALLDSFAEAADELFGGLSDELWWS